MPTRIDPQFAMLAMVKHPDTFPTVVAAVDKEIGKYLTAHFKHKEMGLDRLRATYEAFGGEGLALVFEALDEKTIEALLKKIDPHKGFCEPNETLTHLGDLASGKIKPELKPEKPKKMTASRSKPPLKRAGSDKAAAAKGTGTRPTGSFNVETSSTSGEDVVIKSRRQTKSALKT